MLAALACRWPCVLCLQRVFERQQGHVEGRSKQHASGHPPQSLRALRPTQVLYARLITSPLVSSRNFPRNLGTPTIIHLHVARHTATGAARATHVCWHVERPHVIGRCAAGVGQACAAPDAAGPAHRAGARGVCGVQGVQAAARPARPRGAPPGPGEAAAKEGRLSGQPSGSGSVHFESAA